MTGVERDWAEHNAALLRFGGKMPKGKKSTWTYGGKHLCLSFDARGTGEQKFGWRVAVGQLVLTWAEGQGTPAKYDQWGQVREGAERFQRKRGKREI